LRLLPVLELLVDDELLDEDGDCVNSNCNVAFGDFPWRRIRWLAKLSPATKTCSGDEKITEESESAAKLAATRAPLARLWIEDKRTFIFRCSFYRSSHLLWIDSTNTAATAIVTRKGIAAT